MSTQQPQANGIFPRARRDQMKKAAREFNATAPQKTRFDAILPPWQEHGDGVESAYLGRQLEYIRPGLVETLYPALKAQTLVPVSTEVDPGAEEFTYQVNVQVGEAKVTGSYQGDIPRAGVYSTESSQKIRGIMDSYEYTFQEARAAMFARRPIDQRKAKAARDIIEFKLDAIGMVGVTEASAVLKGLLTLSGTDTYTTPNGLAGDTEWETKTPDEILKDMNGAAAQVVTNTKEIWTPNVMVLPISSLELIRGLRVGDGTSESVLSYFLRTNGKITKIVGSHKAETNAAWTGKRMTCYVQDPTVLEFHISQMFEQFSPQTMGFSVVTNCHARTGGVVAYHPKAVIYGDQI